MNKLMTAAMAATLSFGGSVMAQDTPLDAAASDPVTMGWMQGFPPAPAMTIRFTDADFFSFPKLRWTVCHFRELMPTVSVPNASGSVSMLPADLDAGIDAVEFKVLNSDEKMTFDAAFDVNYTDGLLVLHHGRIVYERYDGCLTESTLHGAMSVTKSITGLMAEALIAEGRLNETAPMSDVIPELADSAFGNATVVQVLEMTTALDYSEDESDPDAEFWRFAEAGSPLPRPEGYEGPRSYYEYLMTVQQNEDAHGDAFAYKTVNSDAVGWLVARTTGVSVAQYLSERIWRRIGAEREAFYTVDSISTPFSGGGFNATLRDMGRLGQLILQRGKWNGKQVIPAAAIDRIRQGGDHDAFTRAGYDLLPGWTYRGQWWVSHDDNGAFAARGVHGQTIWIDPTADMVIVRFASHPVANNAGNDPTSLPAYRAVAAYLMAQDDAPMLVGRGWLIENIAGRGVIDRSPASLQFLPDGSLAGNTTCNRLIGSFEADEGALTLELTGTTMMACPPAMANQEQNLLDFLAQVISYSVDDTGALILETARGETIIARRR